MVIVDECHHVAAFTFERVLRAVKAKYVYGLSATPMRKDGHHPIIFMQCGPVRYLVDAKSQAEQRSFSHVVIPRLTQVRLPHANSIQDVFAAITENTNRNALIAADAKDLLSEGRSLLILTERKTCKNRHPSPICTQFEHHPAGVLAPLSRSEAPMPYNWFSTAIL